MKTQPFYQEYLGAPFQEDERAKKLRELVSRYMAETEDYDRRVCTGQIIRGRIMPATPHEYHLVLRNANSCLKVALEEVRRLGLSEIAFRQTLIGERKIQRK
jgi:hypothetical protein